MAWTEKYCSPNGAGAHDGSSAANAWTLPEAITGAAASHRVNVIAGTYPSASTNRVFSSAGSAGSWVWWRGYKTTIGDMDARPTSARVEGTDIPLLTISGADTSFNGAYQRFTNLHVRSAVATPAAYIAGGSQHFERCRFENTGAAAAGSAVYVWTNGGASFVSCLFKATSTATRVIHGHVRATYQGCTIQGGGYGFEPASTAQSVFLGCLWRGIGSHGIYDNLGATIQVDQCTFADSGGDSIRYAATPGTGSVVMNSVFEGWGASSYAINSAGGTTGVPHRAANLFRSGVGSGREAGFGDSPSVDEKVDSSTIFENAGALDYTPVATSAALGNGLPGYYEGT